MEISSSLVAQHANSLHQHVLSLGRGGAAAMAASTAATVAHESALMELAGGGRADPQESLFGISMPPEGKAVVFMTIAMALHYLGYSLARPVTVALFTSGSTGFAGFAAAFPLAMAFVSPMSVLLLMGYGSLLDRFGPAGALMQTTTICSAILTASAIAVATFQKTNFMIGSIPAVKLVTGPLFVFRESYVQLITSQYWSFMASALTPAQSARWFGPITSLTSLASAGAGFAVTPLVSRIGLSGALLGTGLMLMLSIFGARAAYRIADQYGFSPENMKPKSKKVKQGGASKGHGGLFAMFQTATKLFAREPVLGALFQEILASQGLATVLNVCFVACLGKAIPDDDKRAGYVGVFFSVINLVTMVLQFSAMPRVLKHVEPRDLWRALPIVSLLFSSFQALHKDPSLRIVSAALMVMKVSEYSVRRMLDEMVFVPLDFESRFVGKEVLGVFGYRFGKSLMSFVLSGLTTAFGNFGLHELSIVSCVVSFAWLKAAWGVSNLVPTQKEAEEAHQKKKKTKRR